MDEAVDAVMGAELLINARRYDEALRMVAAYPEEAGARLMAATALFFKEDLRGSLREVEKAITLEPDSSYLHAFRSDVLYGLQRKKESLQAAREAVHLDPESATAHGVLARCAWAVKDWTTAQREADETLRLAPESAVAHALAGAVAAGRRRRKVAEAHLNDALKMDPNDPMLLATVAVLQPRLGPQTRAVELLEEAARLDPSDKHVVEALWAVSHVHVRGAGFDRFDIFLGGPTVLMALLALAVLMGWIHAPQPVAIAVIAVAVPLVVAYAAGDFIRNRARLRKLRSGTRAMYLRRFYHDHWMAVLFFMLTLFVPVVSVGALALSVGIPPALVRGVLVGLAVAWIFLGPVVWRTRLKPWLTRER